MKQKNGKSLEDKLWINLYLHHNWQSNSLTVTRFEKRNNLLEEPKVTKRRINIIAPDVETNDVCLSYNDEVSRKVREPTIDTDQFINLLNLMSLCILTRIKRCQIRTGMTDQTAWMLYISLDGQASGLNFSWNVYYYNINLAFFQDWPFSFTFQITDNLVKSVQGTDISIISQEIFDHDPFTRLQSLKV